MHDYLLPYCTHTRAKSSTQNDIDSFVLNIWFCQLYEVYLCAGMLDASDAIMMVCLLSLHVYEAATLAPMLTLNDFAWHKGLSNHQ